VGARDRRSRTAPGGSPAREERLALAVGEGARGAVRRSASGLPSKSAEEPDGEQLRGGDEEDVCDQLDLEDGRAEDGWRDSR
jgi:hypothetical protein